MSFNINKFVKGSEDYSNHDLHQDATVVTETIDGEPKKKRSKKKRRNT